MTSALSIKLLKATPGLAIRPDPDGPRATLVAADGVDEGVAARVAEALTLDVETRDSLARGIQRWRFLMALLRANHARFIKEGSSHDGPFLARAWYLDMVNDLRTVESELRCQFCVDFCLSGPVINPDAPMRRVDCEEPAPDGRFDARLACDYCNAEFYAELHRQCFGKQ